MMMMMMMMGFEESSRVEAASWGVFGGVWGGGFEGLGGSWVGLVVPWAILGILDRS